MSATDFAALTGVSRERLRTWERRHGFPVPVRVHGGARRYAVDDVGPVVTLRRAVDAGVPIRAAVDSAQREAVVPQPIGSEAAAALAEHAPVTVVALTGPQPLCVQYVNATVRNRPGAPRPGDALLDLAPWFAGTPGHQALTQLFTADAVAAGCEHPDWTDGLGPGAQSIAYRLPHEDGRPPLVALIGIDTSHERRSRRALAEAEQQLAALRAATEAARRFSDAAVAVADLFRLRAGSGALADATGLLVRRLGAVDAAIATSMAGALALGRSARGLLGPDIVPLTRFESLAASLRDGEQAWLPDAAARAFGAPAGLVVLSVPLLAGGNGLGALLLAFDEPVALDHEPARQLRLISGVIASALVRERVAEGPS